MAARGPIDRLAMPPLHMGHLSTAMDHGEYVRSPNSGSISVDARIPQTKKAMMLMSPACNFEAFSLHFHLPLKAAAEKFGVRATAFKKRCRAIGIRHWPYRKVRSLKRSLQELNRCKDQGALNDKQQYQYATFKKQLDKLMSPETYGIDPSGRIPMHHFEDDDDNEEDDSGDDDSYTSSQSPRYGSASFTECSISPAESEKTFGDFSAPAHLRSFRKQQSNFMGSPHVMKPMGYASELPGMAMRLGPKEAMMQQAPYKYPYGGYDHYLHDSSMDKSGMMGGMRVAPMEHGNSVTVDGGPAAAAASSSSTDVTVAVRPARGAASKWPLRDKPMKIEMSAFRDTKFWKWGLQFWHNSKKGRSNEHSRTIRELGFYSMLKLRELQANTKKGEIIMDQTAQGTIEIFRDHSELEVTMESDRSAHLSELGMDLQALNAMQAKNLEPALRSEMYEPGAVLSAFGTSGDVHKMCQSLYRLCMRQGVMFRFNTEVQHILTDKTSVIALQTRRGSLIEGDEFVLALGNSTAPVAKRAGVKLAIYPVKGYVLSVPVADGFRAPVHNIYAGGHALIAPLGKSLLRISGGVDFVSQKKTGEVSPREQKKRYDWLLAQAKLMFPDGYLDVAKMQPHTCWRPVTADDVPLIGRTKIRNLYVNAGHGSKGWTLSFGAGALLADEISGVRPQLDMSKFAPDRFGFFG